MRNVISITLVFLLLSKIFSVSSSAIDIELTELTMSNFYSQLSNLVCQYDYDNSGLSSSLKDNNTNRLIVKTKTNTTLKNYYSAAAVIEGYDGLHILQYANSVLAQNAYEHLLQDEIEYVEYDFYFDICVDNSDSEVLTYQMLTSNQVHLSWNSDAVKVDEAFSLIENSGLDYKNVVVAIIDTGIYAEHSKFINSKRIIDSGFLYEIPDLTTEDLDDTIKLSSMEDVFYHGTHVSGIVFDNTMGNVYLSPYRVSNEHGVLYSDLIHALDEAIKNKNVPANIINISITKAERPDDSSDAEPWKRLSELVTAATEKGIVVVASSGNRYGTASKYHPGSNQEAITVAASTEENYPADLSNKGSVVDIAAPGTNINSTSPTTAPGETVTSPVSAQYIDSGTSMAAPLVAAAAATLKSIHPEYTPADIQRIIKETAYVPDGWDTDYGVGIVNFLNMVKAEVTEVKPTISIKNGKIEITAPEGSDSRIYYSLDGTVPTIDNPLTYTEPIDISEMNVSTITAVCHENGKLIGEPVIFNTTIRIDLDTLYFRHTTNPMPKEISSKADWRSSNPNIASVDCKGNITGVSPGTTYVYATRTDGIKMVYKVTVDYSLWQEILIKLFFGFLWYI